MGLRVRLENLVSNPRLVDAGGDLEFAKSLLEYYNRTGRLSSGRREWVDKLEIKYDEANWVDPMDNATGKTIKEILANPNLSDRDRAFVESLKGGLARFGRLSERQEYALGKVAERYTAEGVAKRSAWLEGYDADKQERARVAAEYYAANPPYYGDLATKVLSEEGFIPTEKQYKALTENKYAAKVIAAATAEAKYPVNTLVEGRASCSRNMRGKKAFVLKVDAGPITNAAKGVKKYLVLPIGEATPILVEEREIKVVKKVK